MERAVATCGTALAEEHVKLLRELRLAGWCWPSTPTGPASRPPAASTSGSAGCEIDVAVAALPPGSDPGELARTDPDGLRAAVEGAKPFLQFRVERILDAAELSTRPRAGPRRPTPPWPRWPSTPTTWSATST